MKLANSIQLLDGRILDDVIKEIEKMKGSNGESVDLSGYAKTVDIEKEITDLKASIPSIDGLAKASDVTSLTEVLNQLISDLKAGKYNVASESTGNVGATTTGDTTTK